MTFEDWTGLGSRLFVLGAAVFGTVGWAAHGQWLQSAAAFVIAVVFWKLVP